MVKRNPNMALLSANYLFPEINARKKHYLSHNPHANLISLGVGDTTEPIPPSIADALVHASARLGTIQGYSGYGPEQGVEELRKKIATKLYSKMAQPHEVFISDGAKCDIGRLQLLFGHQVSIAVQDPAYPVYVEGSIMRGVQKIEYMPCNPENGFFPDLSKTPRTDLIYFCSPNNPTGAVATKQQLKQLVEFARANKSIIIFDSAYANYIQDPSLPKSIFEIEGAREVALEISSFSKIAGFTGVRLGWTVLPEELQFEDGSPVRSDWNRVMSTIFNGASNISQQGGCSVLSDDGLLEIQNLTSFYLENCRLIEKALEARGHEIYGGKNAPYLWVRFKGKKSWDIFQEFLENYHIVTTPGSGFGSGGEGFIRFSAFGHRGRIREASARLLGQADSLVNHKKVLSKCC